MRICVIGAGIIGSTTSLALKERGHDVVLYDRECVAAGASQGNAGAFAFSDIIPLATPGIMRKAPKWLLDPLGPLSIPPSYFMSIFPWLIRFWRASWSDRFTNVLAAQTALMGHSSLMFEKLVSCHDLEGLVRREGQLQVYDGLASYQQSLGGLKIRRDAGIVVDELTSAQQIANIQPGLDKRFEYGMFVPGWLNIFDPLVWTKKIADLAMTHGVVFKVANVDAISIGEGGAKPRVMVDGVSEEFDRVILSAGPFGNDLLVTTGLKLPLETERGYNTTFTECDFPLKTQITFSDHGFVVTRIGHGIRVGGAVELGGLKAPANMKRADALLAKARAFLPELKVSNGRQWMGFRPSMPDSLPVIGAHPDSNSVILAFGHGHLGLTQSAGTADLVADLVEGRKSPINLDAFSPTRFHGYRK